MFLNFGIRCEAFKSESEQLFKGIVVCPSQVSTCTLPVPLSAKVLGLYLRTVLGKTRGKLLKSDRMECFTCHVCTVWTINFVAFSPGEILLIQYLQACFGTQYLSDTAVQVLVFFFHVDTLYISCSDFLDEWVYMYTVYN